MSSAQTSEGTPAAAALEQVDEAQKSKMCLGEDASSMLNKPLLSGDNDCKDDILPTGWKVTGVSEVLGKMPWVDIGLRGVGQVVFMNNPVSGLFIICALAVFNWRSALCGVLSLISGTTTAAILHRQRLEGYGSYSDGLYGFNSILVGLGIAAFSEDAKSNELSSLVQTSIVCIIFGVLSSLVMNSLAKWMTTPAFTLPFNICIMWFFGGTLAYTRMTTDISPHLPVAPVHIRTCLRSLPDGDCDAQNLVGVVQAVLQGVCEIFLAGSNLSAVLILVGMALCSPLAACCCFVGSAVGLATGMLIGVDGATLFKGLYGFNPALTTVAIGGGIFAPPSFRALAWSIFGAVVTTFLNGAISAVLAPVGLPAFTLPFCLSTVIFVGVGLRK